MTKGVFVYVCELDFFYIYIICICENNELKFEDKFIWEGCDVKYHNQW